ncbi:ANTH-domain-containing protein [Hypoxylon trugodes]|uniref:ANTH-domain-containing protein n=1 Tax=Hypoxylon trugodes TaxID=326681 RepID=UPI002199355B|nr:ANTH-domain-containing protein [Hypoxylon trugodes]KAI1384208.1 ANTH-domain-containing protein [Hypoxylon trugodes]
MSSSFEKSVKGATKIKAAPPKTKYIEHILVATHAGEAGVGEVFRALQFRLRDSTWTVVLKSLITIHLMIREGSPDATLAYLAKHRNMLAIGSFTDAQIQGRNIRHYAGYLGERVRAYRETRVDWVRAKETRLEKLSVDKGLLRETEVVQHQLTALLKCDVLEDPENEITITVFRLLVLDLLSLFQVLNQAMINILGHFFEMSRPDAERALEIYQNFTKQTDYVVQYLSIARQWEPHTRVEVPKLKHAPINLRRQLEEYLKDPDFEIHRRQYLAELDAKKKGGAGLSSKGDKSAADAKPVFKKPGSSPTPSSKPPPQATKGPDPDLIDFFDSIEQNQTAMAVQPNPQPQITQVNQPMPTGNPWPSNTGFAVQPTGQLQGNGFVPQPTGFQPNNSPFQQQNVGAFSQQQQVPNQMQPNFTGAGFGGYTPQPAFTPGTLPSIPQDTATSFPTGTLSPPMQTGGLQPGQQTTNPFRASMMMANPTGMTTNSFPPPTSPQTQAGGLSRQNTNPFARSSPQAVTPFSNPSSSSPFQSQPPSQPQVQAPIQSATTGTNPFARNFGQPQNQPQNQPQRPQTSGGLMPQPTGSTNPFRQGAFVNHQTGMGWQHGQQPIGGGLDHLETMPVFPRPATQTPWQQ